MPTPPNLTSTERNDRSGGRVRERERGEREKGEFSKMCMHVYQIIICSLPPTTTMPATTRPVNQIRNLKGFTRLKPTRVGSQSYVDICLSYILECMVGGAETSTLSRCVPHYTVNRFRKPDPQQRKFASSAKSFSRTVLNKHSAPFHLEILPTKFFFKGLSFISTPCLHTSAPSHHKSRSHHKWKLHVMQLYY